MIVSTILSAVVVLTAIIARVKFLNLRDDRNFTRQLYDSAVSDLVDCATRLDAKMLQFDEARSRLALATQYLAKLSDTHEMTDLAFNPARDEESKVFVHSLREFVSMLQEDPDVTANIQRKDGAALSIPTTWDEDAPVTETAPEPGSDAALEATLNELMRDLGRSLGLEFDETGATVGCDCPPCQEKRQAAATATATTPATPKTTLAVAYPGSQGN